MPRLQISWPLAFSDPNLRAWRVYGNPDNEDDVNAWVLLKQVPAKERTAVVEVEEGRWAWRVCGVCWIEQETPIELTDARGVDVATARGSAQVPPVPANPAAFAMPHGVLRVMVDPPEPSSVPHRIQLVRLPAAGPTAEAGLGTLVGEYVARPRGPQGDDAPRLVAEIPASGFGRDNTELARLVIRSMSQDGQPSAAVALTGEVSAPAPAGALRRSLATIDRATGTAVGFPAATTSDGHEYTSGFGARARELPLSGAAAWGTGGWGAVGGVGLFSQMRQLGAYFDQLKVTADTVDLGAATAIALDLYHEVCRGPNNRYGTKAANIDRWTPMHPYEDERARRTDYSLAWKAREILHGGVPRMPLRDVWWEAAWTTAGGAFTPVDGDYKRAVPGMLIYARQFSVRLRAIEPLPLYQLMTGRVVVAAYEVGGGVAGGVVGGVGVLSRVTAQTKVGPSDATEKVMYTYTVPAGALGTTGRLRLRASGTFKNNSVASKTVVVKIKLGGTTLMDQVTASIPLSANLRAWDMMIELEEMNATNVQRGRYLLTMSQAIAITTGEAGGGPDPNGSRLATFTGAKDATVALVFEVTFTLSASDAQLEAALEEAVLEIL